MKKNTFSIAAVAMALLFSAEKTDAQVLESDSLALVDLYNATNGASWALSTNWLTPGQEVSTWYGVTVTDNRVTHLDLNNNDLAGAIPASIGDLGEMIDLDLSRNDLVGDIPQELAGLSKLEIVRLNNNEFVSLPDLSDIASLDLLAVGTNKLTFGDLEPHIGISTFLYTGQDSIYENETHVIAGGDDLILSSFVEGEFNEYQWTKNGANLFFDKDPIYKILSAYAPIHAAVYSCKVTNSLLPNLTLHRRNVTVDVQGGITTLLPQDSLALVDFYHAMDGDNWNSNTNWLDPNVPVDDWVGITVTGIRVTDFILNNNNMAGDIPESFGDMELIDRIQLINNGVTSLPESFANLQQLVTFSFKNNELTSLPDLSNMESLDKVYLESNALKFKDLVPIAENDLTVFQYSPQDSILDTRFDTVDLGGNITLSCTYPDALLDNFYSWTKDGQPVQQTNNPDYTITNAQLSDEGVYLCEVFNNGASALTLYRRPITLTVDVVTSNSSIASASENVLVYPNPSNDGVFNIRVSTDENLNARVYDMYGKMVYEGQLFSSSQRQTIDLSGQSKGVYHLELTGQKMKSLKRVVLE